MKPRLYNPKSIINNLPLVVIVGPTASGKTGLGIAVAKEYQGEIISADSRAIYSGMDIGSAKPTMTERQGVPHWGFDLVQPGERFTAADFKLYAEQKINEIRARGHVPIIVGGTGLYVDSVLFNFQFPSQPEPGEREKWEKYSLNELHEYCHNNNIMLPENKLNKRHVINAILRKGQALKRSRELLSGTTVVGITTESSILKQRIVDRTEQFLKSGVIEEARQLGTKYGWDNEAMTGNIYPLARRYLDGDIKYEEMRDLSNRKEWHLAKRQLTWFRRNQYIKWLPLDQAYIYLAQAIDSVNKL